MRWGCCSRGFCRIKEVADLYKSVHDLNLRTKPDRTSVTPVSRSLERLYSNLVSKAIKHSRLLAFEDLGMEAIYEFEVVDMPVTVAVDARGTSVHITGPAEWKQRIAESMAVGGVSILGQ